MSSEPPRSTKCSRSTRTSDPLWKSLDHVVAEYALRNLTKPVGESSYVTKLVESLPPALRGSLPSPRELEEELSKDGAARG
jgi:hypothetical protein